MKAEGTRNVTTLTEELAQNADSAALGAEIDVTTRRRTPAPQVRRTAGGWSRAKRGMWRSHTKAELERESGMMEAVCERGNLRLAYQRVVENKGAAGVDGIGVAEFKDYLKQHWPTIKAKLLSGEYMPQAVRRVDIPKPQGGVRTLGIPTLADRMIQQALHQVLSPIFEADFSASSYGFVRLCRIPRCSRDQPSAVLCACGAGRPGKNAHQAVKAAQQYVAEGRRVVVDMDLEKTKFQRRLTCVCRLSEAAGAKFFDRVNHDLLMQKLSKKIDDRRILRCILWRQWKRVYTRACNLMKAGLTAEQAWRSACNQRGAWWNSGASHMNLAFPKLYFDRLGLVSLLDTTRRLQCIQ